MDTMSKYPGIHTDDHLSYRHNNSSRADIQKQQLTSVTPLSLDGPSLLPFSKVPDDKMARLG